MADNLEPINVTVTPEQLVRATLIEPAPLDTETSDTTVIRARFSVPVEDIQAGVDGTVSLVATVTTIAPEFVEYVQNIRAEVEADRTEVAANLATVIDLEQSTRDINTEALATEQRILDSKQQVLDSEQRTLSTEQRVLLAEARVDQTELRVQLSETNTLETEIRVAELENQAGIHEANAAVKAAAAASSATDSANSASDASASASAASISETKALNSEIAAGDSAAAAALSETNAAASASEAAASRDTAGLSADSAMASETAAASSAAAASTSEANALASANTAGTHASNAATSETNAATSASAAATSAAAAATSETNAATSATNASNSAAAAQTAESGAESARAAAEQLLDQFGDQYLGAKASDPATDNDGNPLIDGAVYFNTTDGLLKFYTGAAWVAPEDAASTAAASAEASAAAALTSEQNAAGSASTASNAANSAISARDAAQTSENNAAGSASSAASSATSAAGSASAASSSASTASTKAGEASTSAGNAAASEQAAANSASAAAQSEANAESAAATAVTDHEALDDPHTQYLKEDTATQLLAGKADSGHSHDGRYYTQAEIDSQMRYTLYRSIALDANDDLNNIVTNGHYRWISSVPVNAPSGAYHNMLVMDDGGQPTQMVWGGTGDGTATMHIRRRDSGVWKAWTTFWNSGNDGAGSGLDADKLDGTHASGFVQTPGSSSAFISTDNGDKVSANSISVNGICYSNVSLFGSPDGALYNQAYSSTWQHQIYGDYRSGQIAVRGKNNGTWQGWRTVWDSGNFDPGSKADAVHSHSAINKASTFDGAAAPRSFSDGVRVATTGNYYNGGWPGAYGVVTWVGSWNSGQDGGGLQLWTPYRLSDDGDLAFRRGLYSNAGWSDWHTFWHSGNFDPASRLRLAGASFSGTYPLTVHVDTDRIYSHSNITFDGSSGTLAAPKFSGDGSGLTGVDASKLAGLSSGHFLRSNATDYLYGKIYLRNDIENEDAYRDHGVYGHYDSNKTNHIWSMGSSYRNAANGSDFGNLYGLAYKHTNNSTGGSMGGSHQMVWCQGGSPKCSLGNSIWTSGNVIAYSDIRVKTNIEVIPEALEKVKRLSGYTFDRTDVTYDEHGEPETPVRQTGVIAQEVLEVLPEAVVGGPTEDDPEGHYSVAYGNMVGLLIEAIKEQQQQIDELKRRIG